jgi:hypothetical protein
MLLIVYRMTLTQTRRRTNSELLWYGSGVPVRSCHVSFLDPEGVRHALEVQAESLYEAGVIALSRFKQHDCSPGIGSHLEIEIRSRALCIRSVLARFRAGWKVVHGVRMKRRRSNG